MRVFISALLLASAFFGSFALPSAHAADTAKKRPNILWFVSEDNNPRIGCYGDPWAKTPVIDKMASEGVLYLKAFANAPVCAPSRSTLISGMYATSLGTHNMRSRYNIPKDIKFYPDYLKAAGYYVMNPGKTDYNIAGNDKTHWDKGDDWKSAPKDKPWMLVINTNTTHESCLHRTTVHPEFLKEPFTLPAYHPDTPEIRSNWVEYYHDITKMDGELGALLAKLDKDGLADDTIVFYYSDHGGILTRSKRFVYDSGLRTPLVIRFGKNFKDLAPAAPGTKLDRIVSFLDFPPTLLSLAGGEIPSQFQGQAFLGPKSAEPRQYAFGFRNRMDERYDMMRTVRDGRFRYIRNYMPQRIYGQHLNYLWEMPATVSWEKAFKEGKCNATQSIFWNPKPPEELYDEDADKDEVNNLAEKPEFKADLERLQTALREHLLKTRDTGFLSEPEMIRRAGKDAPRTMAMDDKRYPLEKILAAAELASRRDTEAVPKLIELMSDADPAVRNWAAMGFCVRQGDTQTAIEPLKKLLKDSEPTVRITAAEALCWHGQTDAGVPVLIEALALKDLFDELQALNSLDALGDRMKPFADAIAAKAPASKTEYVGRATEWLMHTLGKAEPKDEAGTSKKASKKAAKKGKGAAE